MNTVVAQVSGGVVGSWKPIGDAAVPLFAGRRMFQMLETLRSGRPALELRSGRSRNA